MTKDIVEVPRVEYNRLKKIERSAKELLEYIRCDAGIPDYDSMIDLLTSMREKKDQEANR